MTYATGDLVLVVVGGDNGTDPDPAFPVSDSNANGWDLLSQIGDVEDTIGVISYLYGFVATAAGTTTVSVDGSNALQSAGCVAYVFQGVAGYNWQYAGTQTNAPSGTGTYGATQSAAIAAMSAPGITLIRAAGNEGNAVADTSSYSFSVGTNLGPANYPFPAAAGQWTGYNYEDAGIQAYINHDAAAAASSVTVTSNVGSTHMLVATDNFILTTAATNIT